MMNYRRCIKDFEFRVRITGQKLILGRQTWRVLYVLLMAGIGVNMMIRLLQKKSNDIRGYGCISLFHEKTRCHIISSTLIIWLLRH